VRIRCGDDDREKTKLQGIVQGSSCRQFRQQEWVEGSQQNPPGQQIDAGSFQLAGTGAGQDEGLVALFLDKAVNGA